MAQCVAFLDSHTEGEPTRLILDGIPDLRGGSLRDKALDFEARFSGLRTGLILEPRGHAAIVGCLLLPPESAEAAASLIFFNNCGVLRMCGHGTIGAAVSLVEMGKAQPGDLLFDTPEGPVAAHVAPDRHTVEISNVVSRRTAYGVTIEVPGYGAVSGDVAYGGNWFFLTANSPVPVTSAHIDDLTRYSLAVRDTLWEKGIGGPEGEEIDHIEVFGEPTVAGANSKSFVLCPGGEFDRSPCGTGTSAKIACLAADAKVAPGEVWVQESVLGTVFRARYEEAEGGVRPYVSGSAYVTARGELLFDDQDPIREGLDF